MAKTNQALTLAPDYAEMCAIDDSVGARRYERFKQGESLEEIAEKDKVKVDTVRMDVLAFEKKFELLTQNAIMRERLDGELENEKLRKLIRSKVHKKVLKSIDLMVEGKRKFVSFDQAKGKYITVTAVDYQMMLAGIKEFQKLVSLEQKPQVPTTVVNVNQTNNTSVAQTEDFEERMRRIKQQQKESMAAAAADKIVDVEPIVEEEAEDKEPEWDF
jgi:hypothetical protein